MPNIDDLITKIEHEEGDGKVTNDAHDSGGKTQYGISEASNPEAWADGQVSEKEARNIYLRKYVLGPKFDLITFYPLMAQLVDFGVTSGPQLAIMKLQEILGVAQDGILGEKTLRALALLDGKWVNNQLVGCRVRMIGRIVKKNPTQLDYLGGWLDRSVSFLV